MSSAVQVGSEGCEWGPWQADAACRDEEPDLFFASDDASTAAALAVCAACPVIGPCATEAAPHGIWGGQTETERRSQRRRRQAEESAEKRRAEIDKLATQGLTAKQIARVLGCHPNTVYIALRRRRGE